MFFDNVRLFAGTGVGELRKLQNLAEHYVRLFPASYWPETCHGSQ